MFKGLLVAAEVPVDGAEVRENLPLAPAVSDLAVDGQGLGVVLQGTMCDELAARLKTEFDLLMVRKREGR